MSADNEIDLSAGDAGYEAITRHRWCGGSPQASNRPVIEFCATLERRAAFDVTPDFQRQSVWTTAQREAFLGHWLIGGGVPAIVLHDQGYSTPVHYAVVDGKQRLEALWAWINGEVDAVIPPVPTRAEEHSFGRRIVGHGLDDGALVRIHWPTAHELTRRICKNKTMPVIELPTHTTRLQMLRAYEGLNRAGTPHTSDELARVRVLIEAEVSKLGGI